VALKEQTKPQLAQALEDYFERRFPEAAVSLKRVLQANPSDKTAQRYLKYLEETGALRLTLKYGDSGRPEHHYSSA
jgi:response regulator of citrate/malate metabolism